MRVGLEGTYFMEPATGVGQYVRGLWSEFQRGIAGLEPVLLLPGSPGSVSDDPAGEVVYQEAPRRFAEGKARKLWWELVGVAQAARRANVALIHLPHFFAVPLFPRRPCVVTVHDLVPLVFPIYANSRSMQLYLQLVCRRVSRADLILTDSSHSVGDIERYLALPRERIRSIPLAADEHYRPLPPDDPLITTTRAKYEIAGPFLFNVGGLDLRKNLETLIRAFALAAPQVSSDLRLVISGAAHSDHPDRYPDLQPIVAETGLRDRVIFTGRITDEEKLALLNAAELYVYTALYEGFGITPLEAMRCGTPVVCSDRSSLPEVVGEGGLLVEPTPEKLGAAIAYVLNTPHELRDLRRRALTQAERFSWAETARQTFHAYQEAVGERPTQPNGAASSVCGS